MSLRKLSFLVGVVATMFFVPTLASAATIADWTFETSIPATAGPFSPEIGAGSATGIHPGGSTYSSPSGNGSLHSFSSNTWVVGDSYQFQVNTTGQQNIMLSFDQTSSNTGPRDFVLQYSTNGTSFTNFGSQYSVLANASPNVPWNNTTVNPLYTFNYDLSSISALNNASAVYFRLADNSTISANGGAVASGGTDRVDNVIITGTLSGGAVPAPGILPASLLGLAIAAGMVARRRMLA